MALSENINELEKQKFKDFLGETVVKVFVVNGGGGVSDGKILIDAADTESDYLDTKLIVSGILSKKTNTDGLGKETLEIYLSESDISHKNISDLQGGSAGEYYHQTSAQASSAMYRSIVTKTANYSVLVTDYAIVASGLNNTVSILLPDATLNSNKIFKIKASDITNEVKIICTGAQKIDGVATFTFTQVNVALEVISDGSNWFIF